MRLDERDCEEHHRLVEAWLREYVSAIDPRIGRTGPGCPLMPRALNQETVQTRVRADIDGLIESDLIAQLRIEINDFGDTGRPMNNSGVSLESRVVIMPRLDQCGWARLEAAYEHLKHRAVESGKMIGLFHPLCDDRAVRNSGFKVSRSPVALLAIRHMAPHDILFLNSSRRWFTEYDARFRSHIERFRVRDPFLRSLYNQARTRYCYSS